jgi:tetratricopeptide (TPR) repeat protein
LASAGPKTEPGGLAVRSPADASQGRIFYVSLGSIKSGFQMFGHRFRAGCVACLLAVGGVTAGQVAPTGGFPSKIDELEQAGQLLTQGKGDEAYKLILEAVKKYPVLPPARLILARMLLRASPPQARSVLEQAAAENPDHPEVFLTIASLAMGEGRVTETILSAQKILDLAAAPRWTADQKTTFNREARAALASAYEARGDWENARTHFAAWLELDPKNGLTRQRYATCLFHLDKADQALAEFQTAVKDDATLLPASVMMARQYMMKNDDKKASEFFEKAVKQEANNARVHIAYADYLLQLDKIDAAKQQTDLAAKIDPKNLEVQKMQGMVARYGRDYSNAIRIFREILASAPADFSASNQLALILADMSDEASKKQALQYAEVNARQYQNNIAALSTYGFCLYRTGNSNQARQVLLKCTANAQVTPDIVYFLALTLADDPTIPKDETTRLLKNALDSKGFFFYRKEAKALHDKLAAEVKPESKDKAKGG